VKRKIFYLLIILCLTALFHILIVYFLPTLIMHYVVYRIQSDFNVPVNTVYHNEVVNADTRKVVRPCPDLLYSGLAYDVSRGPVRISSPVPPSYWSISFFAMNTDNFHVVNDRSIRGGFAEVILVDSGASYPIPENRNIVVAPSSRGVVLFRTLIDDPARLPLLIDFQKRAKAEELF